jgi:hypothetical protein
MEEIQQSKKAGFINQRVSSASPGTPPASSLQYKPRRHHLEVSKL